jgi:hypothetical protein
MIREIHFQLFQHTDMVKPVLDKTCHPQASYPTERVARIQT